MHELSIAEDLLNLAIETLNRDISQECAENRQVDRLRLSIGALAGVESESLIYCYEILVESTPLEGSRLEIKEVPVTIFCPICLEERELEGSLIFLCPHCGQPSSDVRQGRELELVSIVFRDPEKTPTINSKGPDR